MAIFLWVVLAGTFYGIWEVGVLLGGWVELRVGERLGEFREAVEFRQ